MCVFVSFSPHNITVSFLCSHMERSRLSFRMADMTSKLQGKEGVGGKVVRERG